MKDEYYEISYYVPIVESILETAYKYVGCGMKSDGTTVMVLVLKDGHDKKALDGPIVTPDSLPKAVLNVLTPGIWPSL